MPGRPLGQHFGEAHEDPALFENRRAAALIDALITTFTERLSNGRALTRRQEARLLTLLEQQRKLNDTQARREAELGRAVTPRQFEAVLAAIGELLREFVAAERLRDVQRRLNELLLARPDRPAVET